MRPETDAWRRILRGCWLVIPCGLLVGLGVAGADLQSTVFAVAACVGVWLATSSPLLGILLLLAATTFIPFHAALQAIGIEAVGVPDLVLAWLFGILLLRTLLGGRTFVRSGLQRPLTVFCAIALASLILGKVRHGANLSEALREFKVVLYYGVLVLTANFVRDRRDLVRFVTGGFVVGGLAVVLLLFHRFVSPVAPRTTDPQDVFYALQELAGGSGTSLVYWATCCCLALLILHGVRWHRIALLAACGVYFAFMFQRHTYGMLGLAAVAIPALTFSRKPGSVFRVAGLGAAAVLLIVAASMWGTSPVRRYAELTLTRMESIRGITETDTVKYRQLENAYALEQIRAHPVLGIGFATSYRPKIYGPDDQIDRFVHNGFLWILLKTGILGFSAFAWLSWTFLRRGFAAQRRMDDPVLRAVALGSVIAYAGIACANVVAPYFMQDLGVAALGMILGIGETSWRVSDHEATGPAARRPAA